MNPLTTHQHAGPTGTTSSAVEQRHRLESTATEQLPLRQHELGVPVDVTAAVTPSSVRELMQLIARHGTAARPDSGLGLTDALWHIDLAVLTGAMHGARTTITLDHDRHPAHAPLRCGYMSVAQDALASMTPWVASGRDGAQSQALTRTLGS